MSYQHVSVIRVYYNPCANRKISVGKLLYKNRQIYFEYDNEFVKSKLELSPFKLPLKTGVFINEDKLFEGLYGLFNDSLPDGWGRLLLDRKLMQLGINPGGLSALDRLAYVGKHGMGALTYEPEIKEDTIKLKKDLDLISKEVMAVQENTGDDFVDELLILNGSSAGARPKILVNIKGIDWIIKFRSSLDPIDISSIEYAYYLMAKEAKLKVPEAKIFQSKISSYGYFGVQRFDRGNSLEKRIHMHSMSGLLNIDHRTPTLDYENIMRVTSILTKNIRELLKQYRAMVFNVFSHNRDDHAKNFSFLMHDTGKWEVSPAYDLTFSSGPMGEHCTMVLGEGKDPSRFHLMKLASIVGIERSKANEIINEVQEAINKWPTFAKIAQVSTNSNKMIQRYLNNISKNFNK